MTRAMKDSGIEWIGQIPENWKILKFKNIGTYINGYAFKPEDWTSEGKAIIRIQDLTGSNNKPNYYDKQLDIKYNVSNGDFLISWAATLDAFIWNKEDAWLNQHIFKAIPNRIMHNKYFFWLIKEAMQNMNNDNKHGIMMQHVTLNVFNNFLVPIPPISEQQKIADYLDKRCEKIDTAIDNQKQIIEKLKEYKQSLITETVTKGLNPNVKMKDSGIEWIGSIPEHWAVRKLRYLFSCQNGISKSGEYFGKGFPFVSYGDVYKNNIIPENVSQLCETNEEERERYSVKKGDIFYTRTSETIEEIGLTSICYQDIKDATFAGFLIRVRPTTQLLEIGFSKYYTSSNMHRRFFVKEMNLVTRASLSQELLKRLPILLPPIDEQQKIAEYLDKKCNQIDVAIKQKEETISKLEEYKKSLIFECVTGKKEVT